MSDVSDEMKWARAADGACDCEGLRAWVRSMAEERDAARKEAHLLRGTISDLKCDLDEARAENERLRAAMQEAVRLLGIALGPTVANPVDRLGAAIAYTDLCKALARPTGGPRDE